MEEELRPLASIRDIVMGATRHPAPAPYGHPGHPGSHGLWQQGA